MTAGPNGVRAVAADLREVASAANDAAGYFAAMYARMTDRVASMIDAGAFEDGPRMDRFACEFAQWYLGPRGGTSPAPMCWRAAFDVAHDSPLLIVQHLLLGINAHVNHDLPQVVVAVADRVGDLASTRADFDAVNDALASQQVDVLRSLGRVSRWVNTAAGLGGGRLFNFSLKRARAQAWTSAEHLWGLDGAGRAAYVAELDRFVAVLGYLITRPGFPISAVAPVLRLLEEQRPERVTAALLAAGSDRT